MPPLNLLRTIREGLKQTPQTPQTPQTSLRRRDGAHAIDALLPLQGGCKSASNLPGRKSGLVLTQTSRRRSNFLRAKFSHALPTEPAPGAPPSRRSKVGLTFPQFDHAQAKSGCSAASVITAGMA